MPRILFTADHDYRHPKFPTTTAYRKGHRVLASTHLAEEAVGLGRAVLVKTKAGTAGEAEPGSAPEETSDDGAGQRG
jgi:hypothetical protein